MSVTGGAQSGQIFTIGEGLIVNGVGITTVIGLVAVNTQPHRSVMLMVITGLVGVPLYACVIGLVTPVVASPKFHA